MFFLWENEGAFVCPLNQFRLEEIRMAYNHGREDRKWRIWKEAEERVLRECGVEYVPGSGISKYCPACAKKIQREKSNECKRRSRERKRQVCIELSAKNDRLISNSGKGGLYGEII